MDKEIFRSERYFSVFDFLMSHGQLLLRASKDDVEEKNIDIIFFGVRYIQLCTSLFGVSITKVEKKKTSIIYESVTSALDNPENCLFEIKTKRDVFYVAASFLKIYENELEFTETSLGIAKAKGREKEITRSRL